jgi:transmembrane sensor
MIQDGNHVKLNAQISDEAAAWFVEFRTGDIDAAGRAAFDAWVRASPEHLRAFIEIAALWNEAASFDPQRRIDVEALIARARAVDNVVPLDGPVQARTPPVERRRSASKGAARAAAVLILTTAAGAFWWHGRTQPVLSTGMGEQRSVTLEDGSTVTLDARSRVRVAFAAAARTVELLDGQAFFHVAKNSVRPFIVLSAGTAVRAVGTQFDVNRSVNGTTVTVLEGRVAVYASPLDGHDADLAVPGALPGATSDPATPPGRSGGAPEPVMLSAGEQVAVVAGGIPPGPAHVDAASAAAWREGQVVLVGATLAEIAEDFSRYSPRRLVAEDHGASPLRVSGVFSTDPEFLLHYLREQADVSVRESDTQIDIVRHAPNRDDPDLHP